ncbi:MAG: VWA domain-containing protein [Planctomycetes bacterium]|nr:VWA domain-containing protein [Planctomycetota bacterium]
MTRNAEHRTPNSERAEANKPGSPVPALPATLADQWRATWPDALAAWSAFVQLRDPVFFDSHRDAANYGMANEIAAIRLVDQMVMVNLEEVQGQRLDELALPVLAHEIGHHVFVPGNLTDNARMIAAIRRATVGLKKDVSGLVANLYGDLHINDRLYRRDVAIDAVYWQLKAHQRGPATAVWKVYTRAYEHLWRLPLQTISPKDVTAEMNSDAVLIAKIIRHYGGDWLLGVRRFAAILYPWLAEDEKEGAAQTFVLRGLSDTKQAGAASGDRQPIPDGLTEMDPSEYEDDPEFDAELDDPLGGVEGSGRKRGSAREAENTAPAKEGKGRPGAQYRQPFEYGELLRALGLNLKDHEVTTRYYRERALPYLIPFPARKAPRSTEPLPEGYEAWETTDPMESMDLFGSIVRSPRVIPGVTTVQRTYGESPGADPAKRPMDLDIYVDSSGSMPNPSQDVSYLALAGAILALSALRMGAKVQATLWSGAGQFTKTEGFVRDENAILGVMTGYLGDGTAFPLNVLRDTYAERKVDEPPVHIVVISDDGVDTMLQSDEKAITGEKTCRTALEKARGGGTLVLNIAANWKGRLARLEEIGFRIHAVQDWEELVEFARQFVRETYRDE